MLKLNRSSEQSGSEESQKDCFFTHQHRLKKKACTLYKCYRTRRLHPKKLKSRCHFEQLEKAMKIYDPNYDFESANAK